MKKVSNGCVKIDKLSRKYSRQWHVFIHLRLCVNLVDPLCFLTRLSCHLDADIEKVINCVHLGLGFCESGNVLIWAMYTYSVPTGNMIRLHSLSTLTSPLSMSA